MGKKEAQRLTVVRGKALSEREMYFVLKTGVWEGGRPHCPHLLSIRQRLTESKIIKGPELQLEKVGVTGLNAKHCANPKAYNLRISHFCR